MALATILAVAVVARTLPRRLALALALVRHPVHVPHVLVDGDVDQEAGDGPVVVPGAARGPLEDVQVVARPLGGDGVELVGVEELFPRGSFSHVLLLRSLFTEIRLYLVLLLL